MKVRARPLYVLGPAVTSPVQESEGYALKLVSALNNQLKDV
jgi:hypothetical protein